ncbi:uncharacterized protein LOC141660579 [Apium graveolens]|uniref:uncharacterized protein LOC141660579 n=1 Tax=Apium graveolens TaxID=4045 RepID=UPI003D7A7649
MEAALAGEGEAGTVEGNWGQGRLSAVTGKRNPAIPDRNRAVWRGKRGSPEKDAGAGFWGSECTKLESVLKLHNWKARFGVSDKAFTDLLQSIRSILPKDNLLPSNIYEAKKTLIDLGLEYIKFHACPNDFVLYRGPVLESSSDCPKCHLSRWKVGKDGQVRVNVPAKVMWYFPIIPRFKRMFKSSFTAELMSWHANNRSKDGKMHHPSDYPSWRIVDYRWPMFGSEARNIHLGLAADGINPHNNGLNNRYSYWPVMLVTYNLPPRLCMKRKFMMITTLISGPQAPGNDIDVYLQPLIDDLKKLWEEGEPNVYDAHTKSFFTLKAILMWTINDFSGYGNLSGCVNKAFNGEQEFGRVPEPLSGEEVLGQQQRLRFNVMHVEKNVCDNIIGTLLHMKFKSKDSLALRLDLVDMGIRPDLAP